ncbi:MAG TPA: hypothetical protein PLM67_15230, partial [Thermoanaerobaculales bacterium]|nr:hypothetical protein [Thermoanaerobaculales bacterium]
MSRHRSLIVPLLVALLVVLAAAGAWAAPGKQHRARLSQDVSDHLEAGRAGTVQVIVRGERAALQKMASRHGLGARKWLSRGVVLEVTPAELEALAADPDVPAVSGDAVVRSSMAVTAETIGTALVRSGVTGVAGLTGKGVGIAVVDSGISAVGALRDRVVAT